MLITALFKLTKHSTDTWELDYGSGFDMAYLITGSLASVSCYSILSISV